MHLLYTCTTININHCKITILIHIYSGSLQFFLLYVGSPKVKEGQIYTPATHIHDHSLSWLDSDTSI